MFQVQGEFGLDTGHGDVLTDHLLRQFVHLFPRIGQDRNLRTVEEAPATVLMIPPAFCAYRA